MGKFKITNKGLYWGLIATFGVLYMLVAFVSTLHAIDFFRLSNIGGLAILLGIAYEVGQASVLFSILMTKNKEKFLPWLLMILLTALQVTANVYASFKHMSISGSQDWTYWYTSILKIFGVAGGTAETYQVIISWISGALLPIVALGMTALVAQNIKLITEENDGETNTTDPLPASELMSEITKIRPTDEELEKIEEFLNKKPPETKESVLKKDPELKGVKTKEEIDKIKKLMTMSPINSGSISDSHKNTLSPGLGLEPDLGDSPREQISKILDDNVDLTIDPPVETKNEDDIKPKDKVPLDLSVFKSPGVFTVDGDPRERGEVTPVLSDEEVSEMFQDELEGKEPEAEEEAQLPPESEFEKFVDNVLPVDEAFSVYDEEDITPSESEPLPKLEITHNNGLIDIPELAGDIIAPTPSSDDMGEMIEPLGDEIPMTREIPPDAPEADIKKK